MEERNTTEYLYKKLTSEVYKLAGVVLSERYYTIANDPETSHRLMIEDITDTYISVCKSRNLYKKLIHVMMIVYIIMVILIIILTVLYMTK